MKQPKTKVLIYIETGRVWPTVKVIDHDEVEVIVVNNDQSTIWKAEIIYNCDEEVQKASDLADELEKSLGPIAKRFKGDKK